MCAAINADDARHTPLFLPRFLNKKMPEKLVIPQDHSQIIRQWQELIGNQKKNKEVIGERKLEGQLTQDFLQHILGWKGVTNNNPTLKSQPPIKGESRTPELALGHSLNGVWESLVLGEYKAPKTNLDDKQGAGYQFRTPVEQARNYASLVPSCQFYLVTNMVEWRLYAKNGDPNRYERWLLRDLAEPQHYWRFKELLSENAILDGKTQRWLVESNKQDKEITQQLYSEYQRMRWGIITGLAESNPKITALDLIELAQVLLDRVLFIAFAEDNALLPASIFKETIPADRYHSSWEKLKDLFSSIDKGSRDNTIPAYNGGLFAINKALDELVVPDSLINSLLPLTAYDFDTEVRVTVLGHIFEQSVAELEQLRERAEAKPNSFIADLAKRIKPVESTGRSITGKRKEDGIVYTPDAISRFIAQKTLGTFLEEKQNAVLKKYQTKGGKWRSVTKTERKNNKARGHLDDNQLAEWLFWNEWLVTLQKIKVIDPSCGSGAFLVAAFDVIAPYYLEAERAIHAIDPNMEGFDGNREILTHNLYGVDINAGAVEIAKLSLWLKTAKPGRKLDSLDKHLVCGNSLRFAPDKKSKFASELFGWETMFSDIIKSGGFDVVLGNPPYVRMEILKTIKPFLEENFEVTSDRADLYCYFYEIGLRLLKPGGRLGYISSSTFFKTGSGEPLRRYLLEHAKINAIVDFGDLQVFEGVTTYPAIVTLEKIEEKKIADNHELQFAVINQPEGLASLDTTFAQTAGTMPQQKLTTDSWQLGDSSKTSLLSKLSNKNKTLKEVYGSPLYGIKTGLNDAFVIDRATRDQLIAEDPRSSVLLRPFLEGKDLKKWRAEPQDLYLIYIPKGKIDIDNFPAIKKHLLPFKATLEKRATKQEWFELQQPQEAYTSKLEAGKIHYAQIASAPPFSIDESSYYANNKIYFIPTSDKFLLALLNSKACWFHLLSVASILRGGFIELIAQYVETIPIPEADTKTREVLAGLAEQCQKIAETRYKKQQMMLKRLQSQAFAADKKLTTVLKECWKLSFADFLAHLKKTLKYEMPLARQDEWQLWLEQGTQEIQKMTMEIARIEREINELVYGLFKLNKDEIALIEKSV